VIGFLMIVALLGTLFSMYLIYVVPIQGKDAEISHMKYITQQFIDVKSDIDSLIINERVNMPIARSFELGTLSSSGQGSLSIIPIQSFIEAAGTLVVNEQMDYMSIQGAFKTYNETSFFLNVMNVTFSDSLQVFNDRQHLYVSYPGIQSVNNTVTGNISMTEVNGTFRILPVNRYYVNLTEAGDPYIINTTNISPNATNPMFSIRNRTDVLLEIYNYTPDGPFLQYQKTLLENASPGGHLFDLYAGNEITINNSSFLNYTKSAILNLGDATASVSSAASSKWEPVIGKTDRLGSLQYWSQNRYWINQELLYEMGGLFLKQNEGVSIMLIPSLAITPVEREGGAGFKVSLVDISITDTNDVSGTKSAQIFAKVDSVVHNQIEKKVEDGTFEIKTLTPEEANSKFLAIRFKPDKSINRNVRISTTKLWKRAFDQVKVVTLKTMSEKGMIPQIPADSLMKTYYIDDPDTGLDGEDLSANLLIGNHMTPGGYQGLDNTLFANSYTDAATFLNDVNKATDLAAADLADPPEFQSFPFEYTKAKVSLVMQSGAL
jgi:hypothetical protein